MRSSRIKWHRSIDMIEYAQSLYKKNPDQLHEIGFLVRNILYDITNTSEFNEGTSYAAEQVPRNERVRDHVLGRTYAAKKLIMGPPNHSVLDGRSMRGWIEDSIYDFCFTRDVTKEEHDRITARGNSDDAYHDVWGPWNG